MSHEKPSTVVAFGEVLWDILPDKVILGGAPFNFAYRINSLGHDAYIISRVGKDENGGKALDKVREMGMSEKYIQQDSSFPTGTVEVFLDENRNPDYEIITGVAYDHVRLEESLINLVHEADCLCFGTLAQRSSESKKTLHAILASFKGRYRFYDINLRKNCYTRNLIHSSLLQSDILKLNENEARELDELLQLNAGCLRGIGEELISRYPIQTCLITLGRNGVLALTSAGELVYEPGYSVSMEDPLGSGDAFSAGFLSEMLSGSDLRNACRFGNQLGAIVATQAGATQTITSTAMEVISGKTRFNVQAELNEYIQT
jgi:fructokinase